MFKMSWWDYLNNQYNWAGKTFKLYSKLKTPGLMTEMLFLLHIHRNRWVALETFVEFIYFTKDVAKMPNSPFEIIRNRKYHLIKKLPPSMQIIQQYGQGYKMIDLRNFNGKA